MAEQESNDPGLGEDALPMQKTSPIALIVAGVAVLLIGGVLVFALSGSDEAASAEQIKETEKAANAAQGMTKEEIEAKKQHLQMTQAALVAAAADDAEEDKDKKAAEAQKQAAAEPAPSPAPAGAKAPAPAPKPANTKKSADALDALGADITSALK